MGVKRARREHQTDDKVIKYKMIFFFLLQLNPVMPFGLGVKTGVISLKLSLYTVGKGRQPPA